MVFRAQSPHIGAGCRRHAEHVLSAGRACEVPTAREIVPTINDLAARVRDLGVSVIWVLHINTEADGVSDSEVFFTHVVRSPDVKKKMVDTLALENRKVGTI